MLLLIACGQIHGQSKIPSLTDTTAILKRPPKRLIYEQEKGVFLNELQEQVTLEKLIWKEVYKQDAVSMYWVNVALEERIVEVLDQNKKLKQDLMLAETAAVKATGGMEHYKTLYKEQETANKTLRLDNSRLKVANFSLKLGIVGLAGTTIYLGVKSRLN